MNPSDANPVRHSIDQRGAPARPGHHSRERVGLPRCPKPVPGTWLRLSPEEWVVGATLRAVFPGLVILVGALLWNGLVLLFCTIRLAATLQQSGMALPGWYPVVVRIEPAAGWGRLMGGCLFLAPLIAFGVMIPGLGADLLYGRVEVSLRVGEGMIFTGIGRWGRRRQFRSEEIERIWVCVEYDGDGTTRRVCLGRKAGKPILFGHWLAEEQCRFLVIERRCLVARAG